MPVQRLMMSLVVVCLCVATARAEPKLKALLVDGQNNHDWKATTPLMKSTLEVSGLFSVDVATAPPADTAGFAPEFSDYDVVVSNYNGQDWPKETQDALVEYMKAGGGLVIVHAANNSFPNWPEYNKMIGLGGWGGRNEQSGPYLRLRDGKIVKDKTKGTGGSHGSQHAFQVIVRDNDHPITTGMPSAWMHVQDELYDRLRGPAENVRVLATAWSDPKTGGSGEHEPMIFTVDYGKGRVFHTPMGHSTEALRCVGFIVTLQRGAEWAATGKVTQTKIPDDFPTADTTRLRASN